VIGPRLGYRTTFLMFALLIALAACASPTGPESTGNTSQSGAMPAPSGSLLRKVQDRGKLVIGVKYDIPTFGYLDPRSNQLQGFDVDLGKAIAREVLGSESKADFTQARSADRIPFLNSGQVDLVLSTMTANEERAREIDFTETYYIAGQSLLVNRDSPVTGIRDLAGKTVCSVSGSTSEKNLREKAPQAQVILFGTYSECVQNLDTRRADAVTTDDIILLGFVKDSPDRYKVVGGQFTIEPYAGGVAKNNTEFLAAVNAAIRAIKMSGEWKRIYEKNLPGVAVPEPPPADWREVYRMQPSGG
jgi:aspartate/glutamate/glutamine transport system substrate-binding protein